MNQKLPHHEQIFERLSVGDQVDFRKLSNRIFHRSLDDCHGACPFKCSSLAKIVGDAIQHGNGSLYELDSFIVIPNHVHALVQFCQEDGLEIVSQSWMRYTARLINKETDQSGPVWPSAASLVYLPGEGVS